MESEILNEKVKWECRRVADAFGVLTFEVVSPLKLGRKRSHNNPVTWDEDEDFDDVLPFKATRPIKFEGTRLDGVPVTWEVDEGGQLMSVRMIESKSNYGCGVELQFEDYKAGQWVCGVYKPFNDIMADGLTSLGFDEDVIGVYRPKMTQQEAQTWFERLTKIWVPESLETNERVSGPSWGFSFGQFHFHSFITEQVRFAMHFRKKGCFLALTRQITHWDEEREEYEEPKTTVTGNLSVGKNGDIDGDLMTPSGEEEIYAQFADEWMPFFRRGCWLSGVPIDASAYEKAQWTEGFTREELESWNLKF